MTFRTDGTEPRKGHRFFGRQAFLRHFSRKGSLVNFGRPKNHSSWPNERRPPCRNDRFLILEILDTSVSSSLFPFVFIAPAVIIVIILRCDLVEFELNSAEFYSFRSFFFFLVFLSTMNVYYINNVRPFRVRSADILLVENKKGRVRRKKTVLEMSVRTVQIGAVIF